MHTISEANLDILQNAGIKSLDNLGEVAANFLIEHPFNAIQPISNALSKSEETLLISGGALGVGAELSLSSSRNLMQVTAEYAAMVASAATQSEVAKLLNVSASRIRQRIDSGSIYAIKASNSRICPIFQFDNSATIPNLELVLKEISPSAHPIAVQRFFIAPNPDLVSETVNGSLSPRDWLRSGHEVEPVILLAREL